MRNKIFQVFGFTLLELLIVIAIIIILASILMPTLGKARHRAKSIECAGTIRQMGFNFQNYASDYNGVLPYVSACTWVASWGVNSNLIPAYVGYPEWNAGNKKSLYQCPLSKPEDGTHWNYTYGYNYHIGWSLLGIKINIHNMPSQTMLLMDTSCHVDLATNNYNWLAEANGLSYRATNSILLTRKRHPEGLNVYYIDGHAANIREFPLYNALPGREFWDQYLLP